MSVRFNSRFQLQAVHFSINGPIKNDVGVCGAARRPYFLYKSCRCCCTSRDRNSLKPIKMKCKWNNRGLYIVGRSFRAVGRFDAVKMSIFNGRKYIEAFALGCGFVTCDKLNSILIWKSYAAFIGLPVGFTNRCLIIFGAGWRKAPAEGQSAFECKETLCVLIMSAGVLLRPFLFIIRKKDGTERVQEQKEILVCFGLDSAHRFWKRESVHSYFLLRRWWRPSDHLISGVIF